MNKYKQENNEPSETKRETKNWVITFQCSDSDTVKYVVKRPHFYAAKEDAQWMQDDVNSNKEIDFKINSFDIKEGS